jgi:hypothetical protein
MLKEEEGDESRNTRAAQRLQGPRLEGDIERQQASHWSQRYSRENTSERQPPAQNGTQDAKHLSGDLHFGCTGKGGGRCAKGAHMIE